MTLARSVSAEEKGEGDWRDVFDVNALGPTLVTQTARNRLVECWHSEEHVVSFTRVSLGDTLATDFVSEWDPEGMMPFVKEWDTKGYLAGCFMTPEDVAMHLVGLLDGPENVPISYITPRFPVS